MVYLHICFACQNGKHEECEGVQKPANQREGGPPIMGGSICMCPKCKEKRQKREMVENIK